MRGSAATSAVATSEVALTAIGRDATPPRTRRKVPRRSPPSALTRTTCTSLPAATVRFVGDVRPVRAPGVNTDTAARSGVPYTPSSRSASGATAPGTDTKVTHQRPPGEAGAAFTTTRPTFSSRFSASATRMADALTGRGAVTAASRASRNVPASPVPCSTTSCTHAVPSGTPTSTTYDATGAVAAFSGCAHDTASVAGSVGFATTASGRPGVATSRSAPGSACARPPYAAVTPFHADTRAYTVAPGGRPATSYT